MELIDKIKGIILPIIESNDCFLDDIEYVNEQDGWHLKIYIDLLVGSLDMDTCVKVSEEISDELDLQDPIKDEYYLEVSSPGVEKELTSLAQIEKSIDKYVHIDFKNPTSGFDQIEGYIRTIDNQDITIEYLVKNIKKKFIVNYDNIKFIRLAVKF